MAEQTTERRKEWNGSGSKRGGQVLGRLPDRDRGFFQLLGGGEQSRVSFSIRQLAWKLDQMIYSRWNWKWVRVELPGRNFVEGADNFNLFPWSWNRLICLVQTPDLV
ncbi:uncharacterized protein LOC119311760 isoform X2 [Triticum dicoccoides]|uniref:uncharacterized protein LOC119311760 isoform X2 n=1 Tax=Triticum dicoccoides TaxID=85692 RepID=UPI00189192D1|nr:uncharacterized protein LOC119311760 isoform X2 [Triticum dicoccoides]